TAAAAVSISRSIISPSPTRSCFPIRMRPHERIPHMIRRTWRGRWTILAAALLLAPVAAARADLIFPALSYRSGPYASGGSAFADGFEDYFTLLNERDGGINGVRIQVPECDTGYNSDRGAECYEAIRGLNPLLIQPLSTSLAARILPR